MKEKEFLRQQQIAQRKKKVSTLDYDFEVDKSRGTNQ
jgi:hypothetical protein